MTDTKIFVFTQDNCSPCYRLKDFINTLPSEQQDAIEFVPFKAPNGQRTALAEELDVEVTPTLVVAAEEMRCTKDADDIGYWDCNIEDDAIEVIIGGQNITTALPGVILNYILSEDV